MKKSPVAVFSTWATNGKDEGMERNHKAAVENMLGLPPRSTPIFPLLMPAVATDG